MKRQNLDGSPIYSDETWSKMLETGDTLLDLGYQEALEKQNLFYKMIYKNNGEYEILFADLRGDMFTPIWKNLRLSLYPNFNWEEGYSCNSIDFGFQKILLRRHISIPVVSDYIYCSDCNDDCDPVGYCEICNKDILLDRDLTKSQDSNDLDSDIELYYCDSCKIELYDKIKQAKLCVYCKERDWVEEHHVTYEPELTIRVCRKCHSGKEGIHWWGFPNLLWKQRKKDYDELKRKKRREIEAKKPINLHICRKCEKEVYSTKRSSKCPICDVRMKLFEGSLTNFHCIKCSKKWSGVIYHDYCPECILGSTSKMSEEDKMILRINIQSSKEVRIKNNEK